MKLPEFFGLDIGNHSIKVAQVEYKNQNNAKLIALGHIDTPQGILALENDTQSQQLVDKIIEVKKNSKINTNKVIAALPESSIFTRLVLLPDVSEQELEESIYYEAKQYLPTPIDEVQLDYIPIDKVIVEGRNLLRALLVAAPKTIANKYKDIIEKAGLELLALETETIAIARTMTYKQEFSSSVLVLDFGANGTNMSVIKGKKLIFSQSIGTGSDTLTKTIASDFSLDYQQAEQYKRTYGLLLDQAEGKIVNSLSPVMQIIVNEINKTINYFRAHLQESTPKAIFLVGDGAKLPGLDNYLTQQIGIEARLSDPVALLEINEDIKAEIAQITTVGYTIAVGLALKQE